MRQTLIRLLQKEFKELWLGQREKWVIRRLPYKELITAHAMHRHKAMAPHTLDRKAMTLLKLAHKALMRLV
tara:strand:+ start:64 stop:276 length:213 start_codon:yes stop_codon:yes gene_type:complete